MNTFKDLRDMIMDVDRTGYYVDPDYPEFQLQIYSHRHQVNLVNTKDMMPIVVFLFDEDGFSTINNAPQFKAVPVINGYADWDNASNVIIDLFRPINPGGTIPGWTRGIRGYSKTDIAEYLDSVVSNYKK